MYDSTPTNIIKILLKIDSIEAYDDEDDDGDNEGDDQK